MLSDVDIIKVYAGFDDALRRELAAVAAQAIVHADMETAARDFVFDHHELRLRFHLLDYQRWRDRRLCWRASWA